MVAGIVARASRHEPEAVSRVPERMLMPPSVIAGLIPVHTLEARPASTGGES